MNQDKHAPLKSKLEKRRSDFNLQADAHKKRVYREGLEAVEDTGILRSAKQVGDKAPAFTLTNAIGQSVTLEDYLEKGEVVLTWYRGGWCPYCNLSLQALNKELKNFKSAGANLFALTPELPNKSISTVEKQDLEFEVLSDIGNKVARAYGIVFKLTDEVAEMYNHSFGLNDHNGDSSNELPLAATYVIGQDGIITYAYLDADYRTRAEPADLTAFLQKE